MSRRKSKQCATLRMAPDPASHRVVVDTNLLVSGLIMPHGLPRRLIDGWRAGAFQLLITDAILAEYTTVLARPRFAAKYGMTPAIVAAVVRRMRAEGVQVIPAETLPVTVRDPKDIHLLAAAVGGHADYLVTGDEDLLVLDGTPTLLPLQILTVRTYLQGDRSV